VQNKRAPLKIKNFKVKYRRYALNKAKNERKYN
jgi:hypothetical protein